MKGYGWHVLTFGQEGLAALRRQRLEQNRKFFALEPSEEFVSALPLQVVTDEATGRITGGTLYALVEALTVVEPCTFSLSYDPLSTLSLSLSHSQFSLSLSHDTLSFLGSSWC